MLILSINLMMSLMLIFITHPLSMGLILLIQTSSISMLMTMMNKDSWYSYIMFLIMIGGMMVLFIYMTSVASNEKFNWNMFMLIIPFIVSVLCLYINIFNPIIELNKKETSNELLTNNMLDFTQYWYNPNMLIFISIFIILMITMIATIKITKLNSGPLRHLS